MQAGAEEEDGCLCEGLAFFPSDYGLKVDVAV